MLIVAKISKPLDNFTANICVTAANIIMKIRNTSIENIPNADVIIKLFKSFINKFKNI